MSAIPVSVVLYDETNITPNATATLANGAHVHCVVPRPGQGIPAELTFTLPLGDPDIAVIEAGMCVRVKVGSNEVRAFIVDEFEDIIIDEGEDAGEYTKVICVDILDDGPGASIVHKAAVGGTVESYPVRDHRSWGWWAPDYVEGSGWAAASVIGAQGWESTYYTGLPGGFPDPAALWLSDGAGDENNAPEGYVYGRRLWTFSGDVRAILSGAGDNRIRMWVDDEHVLTSGFTGMREFEETYSAGDHWLCWELWNGPDDGPVGGNPTSAIWTLIDAKTNAVLARSDTNDRVHTGTPPGVPIGRIASDIFADNAAMDAWTQDYTDTLDSNGATFPLATETFRIGDDTGIDVLDQLAEIHADYGPAVAGKVLKLWVKGTHGTASTLALVTGRSVAGQADPSAVNVTELHWKVKRPPFNGLLVRWADNWRRRPSPAPANPRWRKLDLSQAPTGERADEIADALLDVWADGIAVASVTYSPVDATEYPWTAFTEWSTIEVPTREDPEVTTPQEVVSITLMGDGDGDAEVVLELGSPVTSAVTRIERMISRLSGAGAAGGLSASAVAAAPRRVLAESTGHTEWHLCSNPNQIVGVSGVLNPPGVGRVSSLRLECRDGISGNTSVTITRNGTTVTTLTVASGDTRDVLEGVAETWVTNDELRFNFTSIGHEHADVYAGVSRAGG